MDEVKPTLIKKRGTIGANATIVCGGTVGHHAFIGGKLNPEQICGICGSQFLRIDCEQEAIAPVNKSPNEKNDLVLSIRTKGIKGSFLLQ